MFEVSLERLKPCTILVAVGKPLSVLAAIRMTKDHDKLGRVVVVPCLEFQRFVVTFKKPLPGRDIGERQANSGEGPLSRDYVASRLEVGTRL